MFVMFWPFFIDKHMLLPLPGANIAADILD